MASAIETTPTLIPPARRVPDRFRSVMALVAAVAPVILVVIVVILFQQAVPAVRHFGLGFLIGTVWNPVTESFGALPAIFGTVTTSFMALAIAIPVGVAVAVFLAMVVIIFAGLLHHVGAMAFGRPTDAAGREPEAWSPLLAMMLLAGIMILLGLTIPAPLDGLLRRAMEIIVG